MSELWLSGSDGLKGQIMTQKHSDLRQILNDFGELCITNDGVKDLDKEREAAHTKIVELFMDIIGEDEINRYAEKYHPGFNVIKGRNQLRSELRKKIKEL